MIISCDQSLIYSVITFDQNAVLSTAV